MVPKASTAPGCAVHRPPYTRRVDEHSGRRLARSTAIFSLATGLSRILRLVREVVASYYFGAAGKINAFTVAFQVPNLVRALVADAALQSAFVPVFTELLEKGERRRAWRVASSLFWLVLLVLSALTACQTLLERSGDPVSRTVPSLIGLLVAHVGRVRDCQLLADEGLSSREAAARLKRHPFYVEKLYAQARNYGPDELREAVVRLAMLDHAVKGGSRLAVDLELERALVDITRPREAVAASG